MEQERIAGSYWKIMGLWGALRYPPDFLMLVRVSMSEALIYASADH